MEPTEGLEPPTVGLQIRRTTSCATLALANPISNHSSMKRMISLLYGFVYDGQIKEHELFRDIMAEDTIDDKIVKSLRNKVNIATEIMGEELKAWI